MRGPLDYGTLEMLDNEEDKLNNFPIETAPQRYGDMPPAEAVVYQRVFRALGDFRVLTGRRARVDRNGFR